MKNGRTTNDNRWKEAVIACLEYDSKCNSGMKKIKEIQDPGQDLNYRT